MPRCKFALGTPDRCTAPATVRGPGRRARLDADGVEIAGTTPLTWCPEHSVYLSHLRDELTASGGAARRGPRVSGAPVTVSYQPGKEPRAPRLPVADRALAVGRHVWASDAPVSRADLATLLGMRETALTRPVRHAVREGWIIGRAGGQGGGYGRGVVKPPSACAA